MEGMPPAEAAEGEKAAAAVKRRRGNRWRLQWRRWQRRRRRRLVAGGHWGRRRGRRGRWGRRRSWGCPHSNCLRESVPLTCAHHGHSANCHLGVFSHQWCYEVRRDARLARGRDVRQVVPPSSLEKVMASIEERVGKEATRGVG